MKIKTSITALFVLFILASCAPVVTMTPETEVATFAPTPTASKTPQPTKTYTPEPTATEALTAEQKDFFERRFNEKTSLEEGVTYGILYESEVNYLAEGGVSFGKDGVICSTLLVDVYNPTTQKLEEHRVLGDVFVDDGTDANGYLFYAIEAGSFGVSPQILPLAMIKNFRGQYFDISPAKKPIIKIMFNYIVPAGNPPINAYFDNIFPQFNGTIQDIYIPEVGKILPVRGILPEGYPGW